MTRVEQIPPSVPDHESRQAINGAAIFGPSTELSDRAFDIPYRDDAFGGPTDPVLVWDPRTNEWVMFYTQRRAKLDLCGTEWVHGTKIGIARSRDGGESWSYAGTVVGLEANDVAAHDQTHWAPDVVRVGEKWLMFLSVVDGIYSDWSGEASIHEYVSDDLVTWTWLGRLNLQSSRVIDAAVAQTPDGLFRLWYKDERRGQATCVALTNDPYDVGSWRLEGPAVDDQPHEGPKVFELGGWWWMVVDEWHGLAVHRSSNGIGNWSRQRARGGIIAEATEITASHRVHAHHADVVPMAADWQGERAMLVYFNFPDYAESSPLGMTSAKERHSHIRSAILRVIDDSLLCSTDDLD